MIRSFFLFCSILISFYTLHAQGKLNSSSIFNWKSDSSIVFKFRSTNFGNEQLVNIDIVNKSSTFQQSISQQDSVFIGKGISTFSRDISIKNLNINPYQDTLSFQITLSSSKTEKIIHSSNAILLPRITVWSSIQLNDSSLIISPVSENSIDISINSSFIGDTSNFPLLFKCKRDTVIHWDQLVQHTPFQKRSFELVQQDVEGKQRITEFRYKDGTLRGLKQETDTIKDSTLTEKKKKAIQLHGNIGIESNFFRKAPQHSNGSQYPYTAIRASNTISLFGLPFTINASHSTNDNISPNFRNFFSFQFDVASYREQIQQQLLDKELSSLYSVDNVMGDIEDNKAAIKNLENTKELLHRFPNESINVDSMLSNEFNQAIQSQKQDSLFQLDSLSYDSSSIDSLNFNQSKLPGDYQNLDSSIEKNEERLEKIQKNIDRLKRSNELKEKYLSDLKEKTPSSPKIPVAPNQLFSEFGGSSFISTLLRFEKFELGNFYEFAGQYSVRDIEMKGVNTSVLLNSKNKASFLYGEVNNFQSFNLDDIEENKKVVSFALSNSNYNFLKPTIRVTQFKDESVNPEVSNATSEYYVMSLNAEGEIGSFISYNAEVNQSNQELNPLKDLNSQEGKNMSYFFKSYYTPISFLDIKLQFDQVGSSYQSDGVYFLNRNSQAYTAGIKLRLFKNKVHLKNDFSILHRNFEQKELTNKTQKQFYDIGTHFKRIPNIQISYAPISVEVANQLDTSFSGLDANTNVLIARLYYFKKIKKTFLTTALVYNEIENELADNFSTQKGVQHFISVSNEKTNFSFTSSYDKTFASVRFVSTNLSQKLSDKLSTSIHLAKNFNNHFYSEIIRSELSYQIFKQLNLGVGVIFLIEDSNGSVNSGGSCSLRFTY